MALAQFDCALTCLCNVRAKAAPVSLLSGGEAGTSGRAFLQEVLP